MRGIFAGSDCRERSCELKVNSRGAKIVPCEWSHKMKLVLNSVDHSKETFSSCEL